MTAQIIEKIIPQKEQRFVLPGYHSWEEFEAIEALMKNEPGLRITYLDGCVEFMTLGEQHELIKTIICFYLQLYFFEKQIEYIPVGSATRRSKERGSSFEPDDSYYIGGKKEHPDLAIEVVITSGEVEKLEKYKRFKIQEVWFWEDNQLSIYRLREDIYEKVSGSGFLPDLDIDLFVRCLLIPSRLEGTTEFLKGIRQS
ncbi:Uma2 family endonuclease [Ancylothrix sp. C2]|uniref:Uma2 family endonuclease n=1 Tax=Ancylothrix sp. D3o TaxID=2953691 RepID=UPI0021BB45F1|nr:Uma2 family endonuclease [Ancylothrix sp. D3o]MCT7950425.1 Uma2 family endonuclease [Ancylothrix sp. D3o]